MIPARMRDDASWSDVCIRNVSSHGMMLQMSKPPVTGSYVELRRADVIVVARVMWTEGGRCGLRTQAKVDVSALAAGRASGDTNSAGEPSFDRRSEERALPLLDLHDMAERAVLAGRNLQFMAGAAFASQLVMLLSYAAYQALSRPLDAVAQALR
jgi:hypothetical protein